MDNTNSKFLTLSFALAAALAGFTVHLLIKAFAGAFGVVARATDSDLARHGLPIAFAVLVFALLQFNPKVQVWGEEVIAEVKKVVFPSRKDVTAMTIVVIVMVLISSVIISTFDVLSAFLINQILR